MGWWWVGGGVQDFSVSLRPLCFGFLVFGPGLDKNKQLVGLTKYGAFWEHVVFCPTVFRNLPRDLGV